MWGPYQLSICFLCHIAFDTDQMLFFFNQMYLSCFCRCQQCLAEVTQKMDSLDVLRTKNLILSDVATDSFTAGVRVTIG